MKRKTKTPKERVLARYPLAVCMESRTTLTSPRFDVFAIFDVAKSRANKLSDIFTSEAKAWADAARRLGETK